MRILKCLAPTILLTCCQPSYKQNTFTPQNSEPAAQSQYHEEIAREEFERKHGGTIPNHPSLSRLESMLSKFQIPNTKVSVLNTYHSNAYVLRTGHVYFTKGVLNDVDSEEGIASLMAHELSHLDDPENFAPEKTFEEKLEIEVKADLGATALLLKNGYNPEAIIKLLNCLKEQPEGWPEARISRIKKHLNIQ